MSIYRVDLVMRVPNDLDAVYYQDQVAQRVRDSVRELGEAPGHLLSRRPFQTQWYPSQVSICLALWNNDRTLAQALELAKSFLVPIDTLNVLWPCSGNVHISSDEHEY